MKEILLPTRASKLYGEKFGMLTAIRPVFKDTNNAFVWECVCDCGNTKNVRASKLMAGIYESCGCATIHSGRFKKTHGLSKAGGVYTAWASMKDRCYNKNHVFYNYYGAIGVEVCERWRTSFENFYADMGDKPSKEHSLDRHPNKKGNYEPGNCRWATDLQQMRERGTFVKITMEKAREIRASSLSCSKLAKIYGCSASNISAIRNNRSWIEE